MTKGKMEREKKCDLLGGRWYKKKGEREKEEHREQEGVLLVEGRRAKHTYKGGRGYTWEERNV